MDAPEDARERWLKAAREAANRAYHGAHGDAHVETRRGVRLAITWRAAIAAAVAIALLAGGAWWLAKPGPASLPLASASPLATGAGPSGSSVVVAVAGEVASPGLVTLDAGARVADAIDAAGGPTPTADLGSVNLARRVVDGEQIVVASPGGASADTRVNLNAASADELEQLPGVGPVLAARIVADRELNGPFADVEDLARVPGVGPAIVSALGDVARV